MGSKTPDWDDFKDDTWMQDQIKSLKAKINRMYLLAERLDEEALTGAWTEVKESKMRSAGLIRLHLEG